MEIANEAPTNFTGYEYKEVSANAENISMYIDCYKSLGWIPDDNFPAVSFEDGARLRLKRDRKIINRTELTRLQNHFESDIREITLLEKSKTTLASTVAITTGIIGTSFMACSTFAVTHNPPLILLCIILAFPGFLGWILPYFLYRHVKRRKTAECSKLIEEKHREIYEICEKGSQLI